MPRRTTHYGPLRRSMRERFCNRCQRPLFSARRGGTMEVLYRRCGGIDVHKESISVCVLLMENDGPKKHFRRFGSMTRDWLELRLWLQQLVVTHVAVESTGVYWKPVWNLFEGHFELLLVNAQHMKQVPG